MSTSKKPTRKPRAKKYAQKLKVKTETEFIDVINAAVAGNPKPVPKKK